MLNWTELTQLNETVVDRVIRRLPAVDRAYELHRERLRADGIAVESYIRDTVMGGRPTALTENNFPYMVPADVRHMVYWMAAGAETSMADVRRRVAAELSAADVVVFANSAGRRSVPGIEHYQVFVRG